MVAGLVTAVRANKEQLARDVVGCLVVKRAEGWM